MTGIPSTEAAEEKRIYYCRFCEKGTKEVVAMAPLRRSFATNVSSFVHPC